MKAYIILILGLTLSIVDLTYANVSSLLSDTLILPTEKLEGVGMFETLHYSLSLNKLIDENELQKISPSDIKDIKFASDQVDMKVSWFERLKEDQHEYLETFLEENYPTNIDTSNLPSEIENSIRIIVGKKGSDRVYVVDQNNNGDFRDDRIRKITKEYADVFSEPIKCKYAIYNGKKLVQDSSWIKVKFSANTIDYSVSQHLESRFFHEGQEYTVEVINGPPYARMAFDSPTIAITAMNGIKKDSLLLSERYEIGEYLKFGDTYYEFANVTNDGKFITLIKEKDVSDKIGTQVGFIAPEFSGVTTIGDSVSLSKYKGATLLIVNVSACYSPKMSYEYYKDLSSKYLDAIDILVIDESPNALQVNIDHLNLTGNFIISKQNPTLKQSYREDFCSRVCYLIDSTGHIQDKFQISNWEERLSKYIR